MIMAAGRAFVTQPKTGGDTFVVSPYQVAASGLATLTTITTSKLITSNVKVPNDRSV